MTLQGSMDHARRTGIADLQTRLVDYARHNRSRRERGLPEVSQRRLGDAMGALGHRNKLRLVSGRIHYQGLAWREPDAGMNPDAAERLRRALPLMPKVP